MAGRDHYCLFPPPPPPPPSPNPSLGLTIAGAIVTNNPTGPSCKTGGVAYVPEYYFTLQAPVLLVLLCTSPGVVTCFLVSYKSRIDYFLVSNTIAVNVKRAEIRPSIAPDHKAIFFSFEIQGEFKRGPGLWKFNNQLLEDQNYINLINSTHFTQKF